MLSFYWQGFKKVWNLGKKILLIFIVFFTVITLFLHFIVKDKVQLSSNPSTNEILKKNRAQIYQVINNPELSKTKEGKIELAIYKGMLCGFIGEACTNKPEDANKNYNKSLVGGLANLMVLPLTHPPASGIGWVRDSLANAGFTPKAYAAEGIGFGGIKPFINLWKVFRDVSYMLLVIILIAIGFMIMFRMKLNPQTVISIENALPRIVIALLLITFSFAIAGFLIDLMYILIGVGISVVSNNNAYYDAAKFTNDFITSGPEKILYSIYPKEVFSGIPPIINGPWKMFAFMMELGNSLLNIMGSGVNALIRLTSGVVLGIIGGLRISNIISGLQQTIQTAATTGASLNPIIAAATPIVMAIDVGWKLFLASILGLMFGLFGGLVLPQLIVGVLVFVTILFLMFRIFFMLLRAYLQILLMVILAPVILMMEAVPGRSAFSFWFKNLLAEIMTFPMVIILLVIGYVLINTASGPVANYWAPPLLANSGLSATAFSVILGMGLAFLIPDLIKIAKEQLFGTKGLPVSIGVGTFFGGATAVGGGALGTIGQIGSVSLGVGAIFGPNALENIRKKISGKP